MYFQTTLTENDGKYEYKQEYLIIANDAKEAKQKAQKFAAEWFEGEKGEYSADGGCWYFKGEDDNEISVSVTDPVETTLENFLVHIKGLYVIE